MSEENSLGEMLNTAIRRMGWTHQQVADKFDQAVNRVTVSRWVRDLQRPSDYHLKQLVAILGLNEEEAYELFRAARLEPPKKHNLSSRNRLFTGRESCLELVANHFKTNTTVALSGLPGIGKTQLALEYAHRCDRTQAYSAVLWVNADKASLQSSYADLAEALQLPEQDERELHRRVQAVTQWLKRHTNWLLIMDNADDLELARSFFPDAHRGHILLTTRTQIVGGIARQIEIEKMESEEAQLFLLRRSRVLDVKATLDTVATNVREAARQIVELLDGHPLALDQAGAFIEDGGSFTTYKDLYDKQRRDLLDRRGSLKGTDCDYPETVAVAFTLCFNKARTQHPLADDILNFCAFLHPVAIPEELFQHDDSFKLDTLAFTDGITALLQYSLITRNTQDETFSIHRLVQAVLIDTLSPDIRTQWRGRVVQALQAAFPELDAAFGEDELMRCERLWIHVASCATWTEGELTPPAGLTELLHKSVTYLRAGDEYRLAIALHMLALLNYQRQFGREHPVIATALNNLASLYYDAGEYGSAEHFFQQSLAMRLKLLGAERLDPDTVNMLNDLMTLAYDQNDDSQAAYLFWQTLVMVYVQFGAEFFDLDSAKSLLNLATLYNEQDQDDQFQFLKQLSLEISGKLLYQRALSIPATQLDGTLPDDAATRKDIAELLRVMGFEADAAALDVNDEPSV